MLKFFCSAFSDLFSSSSHHHSPSLSASHHRLISSSHHHSPSGQILVPAMLIMPALVLFAILIVELAKVSQQKILMQFAMDTAVFMEASQASDLANRLAYLNSPWPTRVYRECGGYFDTKQFKWPNNVYRPLWWFLEKSGFYPPDTEGLADGIGSGPGTMATGCIDPGYQGTDHEIWKGKFKALDPFYNTGTIPIGPNEEAAVLLRNTIINVANPPEVLPEARLFLKQDTAAVGTIDRDSDRVFDEIYPNVYMVYGYLRQLAVMVENVYTKLHTVFFRKSFWLNSGFTPKKKLVPIRLLPQKHYLFDLKIHFTIPNTGALAGTPDERSNNHKVDPPMWQLSTIPRTKPNSSKCYFAKDSKSPSCRMRFKPYKYVGPPNHFGVNYEKLLGFKPKVTAWACLQGGRVWPEPKSNFQVILRPYKGECPRM
ncbi:TadE/TadG family type IV pilus assembly protein [Elusimicrobiota bacterium]